MNKYIVTTLAIILLSVTSAVALTRTVDAQNSIQNKVATMQKACTISMHNNNTTNRAHCAAAIQRIQAHGDVEVLSDGNGVWWAEVNVKGISKVN